MPDFTARLVGAKQLRRNLTTLERKVFPRAESNALNRTATKGRKESIAVFSRVEHRKKKAFRSLLRVVQRARARVRPQSILALFGRKERVRTQLSKPFRAKGKLYRRAIPGRAWTRDRPRTSPPNLPVYPLVDDVFNRRARITRKECADAMQYFFPTEVREQIKKLVTKHIRRRAR